MKRLPVTLFAVLFAMTVSHAAPTKATVPDFWYVLPTTDSSNDSGAHVRGIVVPSSTAPTIQTSPEGSVISWHRLDGTSQSFVVQGVSSISFERGPLAGTTYIPFHRARTVRAWPGDCCACASWENMRESIERLGCVPGCDGCGCEACICTQADPCPFFGPETGMRLKPSHGSGPTITVKNRGASPEVTFESAGAIAARFSGRRLDARVDVRGVTTIDNPDSVTLLGPVSTRSSIRKDKAYFAWIAADASVILEQPAVMSAPTVRASTIDLDPRSFEAPRFGKQIRLEPDKYRCSACGTHPNSVADLDIFDCVPGNSTCYRCVSWEC